METYFLVVLGIVNGASFLMMLFDKAQSRRGGQRISEKSLFLFGVGLGALGILLGMLAFRHKTRVWYFVLGIPALVIVNGAFTLFLLERIGEEVSVQLLPL